MGDSFYLWIPGADSSREAKYEGKQEFRGLEVLVFEIEEADLPLGPDPQAGNLELHLSTMLTLKIEPNSGTVVDERSFTVRSYDVPGMGTMPAFMGNVRFAEDTIAGLMDTARSARWKLLWFRTYIPWIAIGLGVALVMGAMFISRRAVSVPMVSEPGHQAEVET